MASVSVDYSSLQAVAQQLISGQQQIEDQLSTLKRSVDDLVENGFVTEKSSGAFQNSYQEFNQGVTSTIAGLEGMSNFLKTTHETLANVDANLASAIK